MDDGANDDRMAAVRRRREAAGTLGAALRRVLVALNATEVPNEDLIAAAGQAEEIARILGRKQRPPKEVPSTDDLVEGLRFNNPVVGLGNPMSPPLVIVETPEGVRAAVTLDRRFEGPPGLVHGGVSALMLDELFGHAVTARGHWSMTASLTTSYRRPVPLDTELVLTAHVASIEGRKATVEGGISRATDPSTALVSATGLFIQPRPSTQESYFGGLTDATGRRIPAKERIRLGD